MVTIFLVYNYMHRVLTENTPVNAANITHSLITIFINSLIPPPNCEKYSVIHTPNFEYIIPILEYAAFLITVSTHSYTQTKSCKGRRVHPLLCLIWVLANWSDMKNRVRVLGPPRKPEKCITLQNKNFIQEGLCSQRETSAALLQQKPVKELKTKGAFTLASFGPL